MGLGTLIRNAVATAHALTGAFDGLQVDVVHKVATLDANGDPVTDEFGKPVYTDADLTAIWEQKAQLLGAMGGETKLASGRLTFLTPVTVGEEDRFELPDGSIASVLHIDGLGDPDGGRFYTEVWLGDEQ